MELGGPIAERVCEGGRQNDLPQASGGAEHRLYTGQGGLHKGPPRVGGALVDAAARHTCSRRRCNQRSAPPLRRLSKPGGLNRPKLGMGPWTQ